MARKGFLTVSQDEVVRRVKPILCGKWLLKVRRALRQPHPSGIHAEHSLPCLPGGNDRRAVLIGSCGDRG